MTRIRMVPFQIRDARSRLGLTQQQLADMLGVGKNSVSDLERGKFQPKESTVRLIRAYLDGYRPRDWPS